MAAFSLIMLGVYTVTICSGLHVKILQQKDVSNCSVVDEKVSHTGTDACIRKITDGKNVYILKQINDASLDEQFLLINDCMASQIGYCIGIPINRVSFIPHDVGAHLKAYPERAATLHTYISGRDLESELPWCVHQEFTLQQRVINPGSLWQIRYPLAENQQGLTRTIIETMGLHENLAILAALDTFIGNSDRSLPNIFYDDKNGEFYGIDQAAAFTRELPSFAYDRLNELVNEAYFNTCPVHIIDSLRIYKNVLSRLCEEMPPTAILYSMQQLVGYLPVNTVEQHDIISARIHHHSCIVEKNYCDSLELITLLEQILTA